MWEGQGRYRLPEYGMALVFSGKWFHRFILPSGDVASLDGDVIAASAVDNCMEW